MTLARVLVATLWCINVRYVCGQTCDAGKYLNPSTTQCESCEHGRFTATAANTLSECDACASGKVAASPGLTECSSCVAGQFAIQALTCQSCSAGYYTGTSQQTVCAQCTAGQFATGTDNTECTDCAAGQFGETDGMSACVDCHPGHFTAGAGATICTECGVGEYSTASPATECVPCAVGWYNHVEGETVCTQCPAGQYQTGTQQTECIACAVGYFEAGVESTECDSCVAGQFAGVEGLTACVTCPDGEVTTAGSLSVCTVCTAGQYSATASSCVNCAAGQFGETDGMSACVDCHPGHFTAGAGATICTECGAGEYSTASPATECVPCAAGWFNTVEGQTVCIRCIPGFVAASTGITICTACARGHFASSTASSACTECSTGQFAFHEAQSACNNCSVGEYASSAASTICKTCLPGHFAPSVGSNNCSICAAGYFAATQGESVCLGCATSHFAAHDGATECKLCPSGTFQNTSFESFCYSCRPGHFCSSTEENICPSGSIAASANATACTMCGVGLYSVNAGSTYCSECDVGSRCPVLSALPIPCLAGEYQAQKNQTSCVACTPGWYQTEGGASACVQCPVGSSCEEPNELPQKCLDGFYQLEPGRTQCEACTFEDFQNSVDGADNGTNTSSVADVCQSCYPGTFCVNVSAPPLPCEPGFYTPFAAMTACLSCEAGYYALNTGASSCVGCPVGSQCSSTDISPCLSGYYQDEALKTACKACAAGRYQNATSATFCYECEPGFFCDLLFRNSTAACDAGTFQDAREETECKLCQAGFYQIDNGSAAFDFLPQPRRTACEPCAAGYMCPNAGEEAVPCPLGWYNNADKQTKCYSCSAGQYANETSSLSCSACPPGSRCPKTTEGPELCEPGWFQAAHSETQCLQCAAGKVQLNYGGVQCVDCTAGSACADGSVHFRDQVCQPGKYQDDAGKSECKDCETGRYQPSENATECFVAEAGTTTQNKPAEYPIECPLGEYQPNNESTFCSKCPQGYTAAQTKSTECIECNPGNYCPFTTEASRSCPVGYYESEFRSTECKQCPVGKYSPINGSSACTECPANSVATTDRSSCVCTINYYRVSLEAALVEKSSRLLDEEDNDAVFDVQNMTSEPFFCMECPEGSICNRSGNAYTTGVSTLSKATGALVSEDMTIGNNGVVYPYVEGGLENIVYSEVPLISSIGYWQNESWVNATTAAGLYFENCWTSACSEGGWSQCSGNKSGPLCVRCGDQIEDLTRYLPTWQVLDSGECYECLPNQYLYFYGAIGVVALGIIVAGLVMLKCKERWLPRLRTWWFMRGAHPALPKNGKRSSGIVMKIKLLLSYFQIVSMFTGDAELTSPYESSYDGFSMNDVRDAFSVLSFEWLHVFDMGCLVQFSYPVQFFTNTAATLGVVVIIGIVFRESVRLNRFRPFLNKQRATQLLMVFLFTIYPKISKLSLSPFNCKTFMDGVTRLAANGYQMTCWEGSHVMLTAGGVFYTLLYPLGIPILFFLMLYRNRDKLDETSENFKPSVLKAYSFLVKDYKADRWYFECLVMLHKLLLTVMVAFLPSGSPQQMMLALLETLIFFGAFSLLSPYNALRDTVLFALTQFAIFCQLLEGLLTKLDTSPLNNWIVVIKVLPFIAMMVVLCYAFIIISIDVKNKATKSAHEMKQKLRDITLSIFGESTWDSSSSFRVSKDQKASIKRFVSRSVSKRRSRRLQRHQTSEAKLPGVVHRRDGRKTADEESDEQEVLDMPTITIQRGRGKKTFSRSESQLILEAVNKAFEDDGDDDSSDSDSDSNGPSAVPTGLSALTAKVSPQKVVPINSPDRRNQRRKQPDVSSWMDKHLLNRPVGRNAHLHGKQPAINVAQLDSKFVDPHGEGTELVPVSSFRSSSGLDHERQTAKESKEGPEMESKQHRSSAGRREQKETGVVESKRKARSAKPDDGIASAFSPSAHHARHAKKSSDFILAKSSTRRSVAESPTDNKPVPTGPKSVATHDTLKSRSSDTQSKADGREGVGKILDDLSMDMEHFKEHDFVDI